MTSKIYNPSDELRVPHDDPKIGYDWLKRAEIK
jgi:dTDP-4-dehydrorhamnose 3,5-epimerase-like enzyme